MTEQIQGILSGLLGELGKAGVKTTPTFKDRTITIAISQEELEAMTTKGIDPRFKNAVKVAIKEGRIEISLTLW